jgi:Excalibur calcium-binding domain
MKRLIVIVLLGFLAWQGYAKYESRAPSTARQGIADVERPSASPIPKAEATPSGQFKCDGRTHCSQMTSCAEATFFLKNCPGVKMDGNNDGVPCEQQWCK